MSEPILEVHKLTKMFGGITAISDVSFNIEKGSIMSLIGPNGAGKTTLFNCITGIYRPAAGKMSLKGREIDLMSTQPHEIARAGVSRTFQNIRLFANMTVLENVMCGAFSGTQESLLDIAFRTKKFRESEKRVGERALELLNFVDLSDKLYESGVNLSYGDQRRLEIARALALGPDLLLLDEPAAGMNFTETGKLAGLIRSIRERGATVLLIEHDMKFVMDISDRIVVLNYGELIADGTPSMVRSDRKVIEAYLGEGTL